MALNMINGNIWTTKKGATAENTYNEKVVEPQYGLPGACENQTPEQGGGEEGGQGANEPKFDIVNEHALTVGSRILVEWGKKYCIKFQVAELLEKVDNIGMQVGFSEGDWDETRYCEIKHIRHESSGFPINEIKTQYYDDNADEFLFIGKTYFAEEVQNLEYIYVPISFIYEADFIVDSIWSGWNGFEHATLCEIKFRGEAETE